MNNCTIKFIVYSILSFAVSSCSVGCIGNVRQAMPSDPNQVMMYMYQQKSLESMAQTLSNTNKNSSDNDLKMERLRDEIKLLKDEISIMKGYFKEKTKTCNKKVDFENWIEYDLNEG